MLGLITEHIDIWTSALKQRNSVGRGSNSTIELYGIEKLRELILDLAIQGKLVPQNSNDEPASELLKKIEEEKIKLNADSKPKKQKTSPLITDEEKEFNLPSGWEWTRLSDLNEIIRGVTYKKQDISDISSEDTISLMRANNIGKGLNFDNLIYIPKKIIKQEQIIVKGDVLLATSSGSANLVGKAAQAMEDIGNTFGAFCAVIRPISSSISPYIGFYCSTPYYRKQTHATGKGIGIQNLNKSALESLLVPIAPLKEQHRIVAKVKELMALCDQLEQEKIGNQATHQTLVKTLLDTLTNVESTEEFTQNWQQISGHFDILFTTEESIEELKKTILQLAVMGKLVPQNSGDEPASELLKKIEEKKERLVNEKKIRKQKPLPVISSEEKPFDLPQGWEWCRLGNTGIGSTGKTPSTKESKYFDGEIPFIGPGQITSAGELIETDKFLTEEGLSKSTEAINGDILMVCIGGSIGKSVICDKRIAYNQQINAISPIDISSQFLHIIVSTNLFYQSVLDKSTGSATPIINRLKWEELLVPIAPKQEQNRIVKKVDELMALCDALKVNISEAKNTQVLLADAILEKAI